MKIQGESGEGGACGGCPFMEGGVWPFLQERVKKEWYRLAVMEVVGSVPACWCEFPACWCEFPL